VTPNHAEVLAAIDKARRTSEGKYGLIAQDWLDDRNAHCDDLRATAERHAPVFIPNTDPVVPECRHDWSRGATVLRWPCPDYQQVIVRLTEWGAL
jgi:hypothetical protein